MRAGRCLMVTAAVWCLHAAGAAAMPGLDAPWSGSGPGTVTVASDGTATPAQMSYAINPAGRRVTQTWTFTATATSAGRKL